MSTIPRREGVRIDAAKLDFELGRRGVTARRLAEVSGVHEVTISRARNGGALTEQNFKKLAEGLMQIPLMVGADLLIAEPEGRKVAAVSTTPAAAKDELSHLEIV